MVRKDKLDEELVEVAKDKEVEDELERTIEISPEVAEQLKETTKADLFKEIIRPDFQKEKEMSIEEKITPFTKELKISNLSDFQLWYVTELTDLATNWYKIGATNAAKNILAFRDILLSVAPSRHGALLKLMNTEYNIRRIETPSKKRQFFSREQEG